MSRILVTGGAGFVGSHVVDALVKADYDVYVMDNFSTGTRENLSRHRIKYSAKSFGYKTIHMLELGEITDLYSVKDAFELCEPEYVIHLAAQPSLQESWKNAPFDAQTNIIGTINLLGLCQRYKVKKFVFALSLIHI